MKLLPLLFIALVVLGLGAVAVQRGFIALPGSNPDFSQDATAQAAEVVGDIDQSLASHIRQWREAGWQPPEILGSISSDVQNATLSATVSTTPQEVWQSFREQGAQAALGQVAQSAEFSVNAVSQNVVNEARYQYCLGVVEARHKNE